MKLISDWKQFPADARGGVLCVGNFDGVHIGHARMLATGRDEARRRAVPFTIMTFDPHPRAILKPGVVRQPLTTEPQRRALLAGFSPDVLLVVPTTREFLSISAEEFLRTIVRGDGHTGVGATLMVEGPTFTFGKGAKGTVQMLLQSGAACGFETIIVPTQECALTDLTLVKVSSTLIRWLVEHGRVADAARALGRPYTLQGKVVEGAKRGRAIGFPTANLETPQLIPGPGIYAGSAAFDGQTHRAAISVGNNPTFAGTTTTVEAFLLDFDGDLYGRTIDLAFHRWVREMYAFSGVPPLVAQMKRDVDLTRRLVPLKEPA